MSLFFSFFSSLAFTQNIGINSSGASPDPSATLDVSSTNGGLLIPRLTTLQRDAINSGTFANALLIYNTTTECFETYHSATTSWKSVFCLGCQLPGSFAATAATNPAATSFDANWSASAGATSYFIDIDDNSDFSSPLVGYNDFEVVGGATTLAVTGLTCNTTYYYRVRASNACGTSTNSNEITTTTAGCFIVATGGTITTDGNFKVHTFNSSGTFEITAGTGDVEYLVIGGGGSGGSYGGGGAGGYLTGTSTALTVGTFNVTVGTGGGGNGLGEAGDGANSLFHNIIATGGGGGGGTVPPATSAAGGAGHNGGSGGGGAYGSGPAGTGIMGQGK